MLKFVASLPLTLLLLQGAANAKDVRPPAGQSYYLATTDILGEELIGGANVLIVNSTNDCFVCNKSEIIDSGTSYFENTESFYSSISESYNLGAQLKRDFTLGVTLDATTKSISSTNRTIKGSTLDVLSKIGHCVIRPECIYNESYHTLSPNFLSTFESLPKDPGYVKGGSEVDFSAYKHFLNEFGSHIVTGVIYGSRLYQHCFSKSEQKYSERNYTVRACVAFSGGSDVTKLNVSACAGISKEEAEASSSLEVTTRLVIRGGTKKTRAQLYAERTSELLAKFLSEASNEEPIEYSFTPVWTILGQKYIGTEHYAKVRHLEACYLGFMNFGCPTIISKDGQWAMQQFVQTSASERTGVPVYTCYIASQGCHSKSDCHYGPGAWCRCVGDTCFVEKTRVLDTGEHRKYLAANYHYWHYWAGCKLYWPNCVCQNDNLMGRTNIWKQDQDRADNGEMLRLLHYKLQSAGSAHPGSPLPESKSSKEEL